MVVLVSTFLDSSLVASQVRAAPPLLEAQKPRNLPLLIPSASSHKTDEEHHVQHRKTPSPSSWISFFLKGSSQKPPLKPLIQDVSAPSAADPATMESSNNDKVHPEHVKITSKKGPKGVRRVSFTPQKARELREKLKGTDSFHDLMYHSAIASRLASRDS